MPEADLQLEQYWSAAEVLARAGFDHYEISNWARPGYRCRHNLTYWEYRPYLGCGAGAHSLLRLANGSSEQFWNVKGPHRKINRVAPEGVSFAGPGLPATDRPPAEP